MISSLKPAFTVAAAAAVVSGLVACSSTSPSGDAATAAPSTTLPGAPEGVVVTLPGAELAFEQTATVATESVDGVTQYWQVTPHAPTELTVDEVNANTGVTAIGPHTGATDVMCFPTTLKQVASSGEPAHPTQPRLVPIDESGAAANQVMASRDDAATMCGITPDNTLLELEDLAQPDTEYTVITLGYSTAGYRQKPVGLAFEYYLDSVDEIAAGAAITWHERGR